MDQSASNSDTRSVRARGAMAAMRAIDGPAALLAVELTAPTALVKPPGAQLTSVSAKPSPTNSPTNPTPVNAT